MTRRISVILSLAALAAGFGAATAVVYRPEQRGAREEPPRPAGRERWDAMSKAARSALLERYQTIARRPDAGEVWRRAKRFAALPAAEQKQLRSLHAVMQEVLAKLPASRRLALLGLPERARAEAVYRLLESESPEKLAELRRQLRGRS